MVTGLVALPPSFSIERESFKFVAVMVYTVPEVRGIGEEHRALIRLSAFQGGVAARHQPVHASQPS